jgi:hypothetical protein
MWIRYELQFVSRIETRYRFPYRTAYAEGTVFLLNK